MYLGSSIIFTSLALFAPLTQGASSRIFGGGQNWYNFITTFNINPFSSEGFYNQPRTVDEAKEAGFTFVVDDCSQTRDMKYGGFKYAPPTAEGGVPEFIMIYDVNGFIAGMHSVIPKPAADESIFEFDKSLWYRSDWSLGFETYVTTAYFVDPEGICTGGRDQESFETEGTGNVLAFEHGDELHWAPLTGPEADESEFWNKHKCFVNMGRHYFNLGHDVDAEVCNADGPLPFTPIQLLYSGGVMNGFVWQHAANPSNVNKRWENVDPSALSALIDGVPKCLYDFADKYGVVTQHVYFRNWKTTCIFEIEIGR